MVRIRRKGPNRSEHVGMQKGANFTVVSTMVLVGFKHQILRNLGKAACILIPFFLFNFLITNSRLSLSNTEIACEDHVKL